MATQPLLPALGEATTTHQGDDDDHTQPNRPDTNDELLTIDEVAEMLRVPIGTLRYWRHLGAGPHSFKVGRWVRYRRVTCGPGSTPSAGARTRADQGPTRPRWRR